MKQQVSENKTRVGLGVLIMKDNKVLFGKRKGSHGAHTWAPPGGHLEWMESFEDCTRREVMEEVGIQIKNIRFATITNDMFIKENKHYVTIFMIAEYASGTVQLLEPEKCDAWEWFSWSKLPKPLFLTIEHLIEQGYDPFKQKE